ncbi:hypothetical protein NE237_020916 [Protea cynaroides]|uniref:Late embryogenesis abundant protein LEA-2 subgroup domain-containing protein n=1 Tax=Protea cynaroides TaxID=273540 RepID=A0A9Q0K2S3_9MAGN|nr:hypothetical protein NE237_020916 [Protea cynaroides]
MCETRNFYLRLLQVIVLAIVFFVLLWFLLPPRNPRYTIINFNVPALNTNIYLVGQEISIHNTTITFQIEIENPNNDYTISSDGTKVTLYYGNDSLGEIPLKDIVSLDKGTVREDGVINGGGLHEGLDPTVIATFCE